MSSVEQVSLGIIDYGAGNLRSVYNSFLAIGHEGRLIREPDELEGITHLVLPGVGSFGDCADSLRRQRLDDPIREWIQHDRPFLGICVGYQALFEGSEETPDIPGLSIFEGKVLRFPVNNLKVPHMGWNSLRLKDNSAPIWKGMGEHPYFYFVHSYYPCPADQSMVASTCEYGLEFPASIQKGRLVATQFHPEKSQKMGALLLENFLAL